MMRDDWTPTSWRAYPALQQPHYQHTEEVDAVVEILKTYPPLVFSGEVDRLKERLQAASRGQAFILHGGDCAERFVDCNPTAITSKLKILLQMSLILTYGTRKSVIRIGRIAGQYAKPRSQDYEHVNGESLPVFRGDNVNGYGANLDARLARPERLLIGHHKSAMTLNFIRALIDGGFADLHSPENWAITYFANERLRERYTDTIERIKEGISFISAIGASDDETLRTVAFYTSHEGLILPYEEAMTRRVPVRNRFYDLSAHMLWIGDRTRQLDGAHVEFFRGVANPIGLKVGPSASPSEVASLCELLNPSNEAGKIVLITRFGHSEVGALLPAYIRKIAEKGLEVVWEVDPMHANLIKTESGIKTRSFDAVLSELTQSIEIHRNHKSILAGIHFEMTGDDVTECIGGSDGITEEDLTRNYESYCDPRLNYAQSLEMAFLIASMHKPS